jgi:hypothetical protein
VVNWNTVFLPVTLKTFYAPPPFWYKVFTVWPGKFAFAVGLQERIGMKVRAVTAAGN